MRVISKMIAVAALVAGAISGGHVTGQEIESFPGTQSTWNGYTRFDFQVEGKPVLVVCPKIAAAGRPWVWHGEFFGHKPAPDIALLSRGFHIVYMRVPNLLGCPRAVQYWDSFYRELTEQYGFAKRVALVGLSRGGLYCYNWAAANPDKVACIYGDAPVCDFKSWPGGKGKGKGSAADWKLVLERYGFENDAVALAYNKNPVDNLGPLAKAGVPLLHVYGDADQVVPWDENTGIVAKRYRSLGGSIALIRKPGIGHHPHGLDDPTPIVDFIVKNAAVTAGRPEDSSVEATPLRRRDGLGNVIESHPNIVMFLVDDMGWQDTSVPFHSEMTPLNRRYHTPNMERLAAAGMKFTQAYASSVCSPTRVSLMTGMNAARHRVTNWTLRKNASNDRAHPRLEFPKWNVNGLSPDAGVERTVHATSLPAVLGQVGYRTIHVGKAHFGAIGTPGSDPRNLGFDVNVGGHAAGGPGSYLGTQNFSAVWRKGDPVWDVPGLEKYRGKDQFLTEVLTVEANRAVDDAVAAGVPFFLYMAHYAVHVPFAPDKRFYQKYRDAGLEHIEAMYAALVEGMDKSLGDILDNIKRHGLSDKTIVLFMSDNGGLSASSRSGKRHTHNKPLSSGKGSAHEGGVRVPMIISWPDRTSPGSICRQPVIIEDFFPTILEMAGVHEFQQVGGVLDGRSFVSLLDGAQDSVRDDRPLFWHFPNHWGPTGPGIGPSSSIRLGDWKLIYYYDGPRFELFDLARDLGEKENLADQHPIIRDSLADQLFNYLTEVGAQIPISKSTGKPVPFGRTATNANQNESAD